MKRSKIARSVDEETGELVITWFADANLSADNFVVQYYRADVLYPVWIDVPQGTIVANGNGSSPLLTLTERITNRLSFVQTA